MSTGKEKIKEMCRNLNIADGKLSDEYIFTLEAVDLFYYKQNIGQIDIKIGFVDGTNDGGIDYIYSNDDTMYLIQGKSTEKLTVEDIKNLLNKMVDTVNLFDEKKYDQFSNKLKSAYLNAYDALNDDKNIELVLFTKTYLDEFKRKTIEEYCKNDYLNNYQVSLYDPNDIKVKEAVLFQDSDLVSEDSIELLLNEDNKNDCLQYGQDGMIVNVKASSVKKLYDKYNDRGLFSYNLREHISQKNVDDGIDTTIKKEKNSFWFYNNGITIGCNDFYRDGNRIKLYDFSIINGAQTTTKIGKSRFVTEKEDFAIVCKIVRAKNSIDQDGDFISKISEASNSQKPIKPRDLKANAHEQKVLQMQCAKNEKYPLAIEIKRGVRPKNYKQVDKWQRVTNEFIGQLIYACIIQKPGPARNSKNQMFSSGKVYKQLFLRKHDSDTLYDLVRLSNVYDEFLAKFSTSTDDLDMIAIAKNGKLSVLAILIYMYKKQKGIIIDRNSDELQKDNMTGLLVTDYAGDDLDNKLYNAYKFIIRQLKIIYETKKESMKLTSYSNFFKSEQVYEVILKEFDELDDYDREKMDDFMIVFKDKKLL